MPLLSYFLFALTLCAQAPAPKATTTDQSSAEPTPGQPPVQGPASLPPTKGPASPATKATPSEPEPAGEKLLARIGQRSVFYRDFLKWLKLAVGAQAEMIRKNPTNRSQAVKQFLDIQALEAKARQLNLQKNQGFKDLLAIQTQQCFVKVLMDEDREGSEGWKLKAAVSNPSEQEIKSYFQAHQEDFATPERFNARHILVRTDPMAPGDKGRNEDEAQAKLTKIQGALKAGEKFEDLVREYSDDLGSKSDGGLYKEVSFGTYAKEFETAVHSQEIGKVGPPVKTTYGYHIIEVLSRSPRQAAEFEAVREKVKFQMLPERRERLTKDFLAAMRKEMGVIEAEATAKVKPVKSGSKKSIEDSPKVKSNK